MRCRLVSCFLLMFAGSALADEIDVGLLVDQIGDWVAAVSLIGTAVIGIYVTVRGYRWVRLALS